nr:MAG: capsid protein [Cressdnaviricota sp.]
MGKFYSPERIAFRRERQNRIGRGIGNVWKALSPFANKFAGIPSISGVGDYQITYNSIMSAGGEGVAQFSGSSSGLGSYGRSVRIQHREYIQDVQSTTAFQNLSFAINPSNYNCFPWLSIIAQNFQEYKFHGLVFNFVSLSAEALNSTNTALGAVIMSTDYNAASKPYASKAAAENAEYTVSCKPSCSMAHGIECDPAQTVNRGHLYISPLNNGSVPAGEDIKTYNLGNFQFMTQGSQAVATIGELWVSYDLELIKPIDSSLLTRTAADHFQLANISPGGSGAGFLFGSTQTQTVSGIGGTVTSLAGSSTYTFPATVSPGQIYLVYWNCYGSSATVTTIAITESNCSIDPNMFYGNTGLSVNPVFGTTGTPALAICFYVLIGAGATSGNLPSFTFTGGSSPSSAIGDLFVTQVPPYLTK